MACSRVARTTGTNPRNSGRSSRERCLDARAETGALNERRVTRFPSPARAQPPPRLAGACSAPAGALRERPRAVTILTGKLARKRGSERGEVQVRDFCAVPPRQPSLMRPPTHAAVQVSQTPGPNARVPPKARTRPSQDPYCGIVSESASPTQTLRPRPTTPEQRRRSSDGEARPLRRERHVAEPCDGTRGNRARDRVRTQNSECAFERL